jgi:hypothetical protein
MKFESFVQFAVKATCIFCGAEKSVGVEEYCDSNGGVVPEVVKTAAKDTFEHDGWSVIDVPAQVQGGAGVVGMACPACAGKGSKV